MEREVISNGFILDLSNAKKASQIIYELSTILDMPEARGKNICLKLGDIDLNQSQLLSIKSLINSMSAELAFINTLSQVTRNSSHALGVGVSEPKAEFIEPQAVQQEIPLQQTFVEPELPQMQQSTLQPTPQPTAQPIGGLQIRMENFEGQEESTPNTETQSEEAKDTLSFDINASTSSPEVSQTPIMPPPSNFQFDELALKNGLVEPEDSYIQMDISKEELEAKTGETDTKEVDSLETLYVQQTVRSGQTVNSDGNVLIIGDAHPGSEIVAKGDITVWGVLGGIAHAGAEGNESAKIRALKINAIQLRIGNLYARRPDTLNIPFIQKTSNFTPQEAKVLNNKIVLYKSNEIKE